MSVVDDCREHAIQLRDQAPACEHMSDFLELGLAYDSDYDLHIHFVPLCNDDTELV